MSIRNFCQRITAKHTANVNELCTYALPRSCWFRIWIIYGVDRKGAEFIDKQIHSFTDSQLYVSTLQFRSPALTWRWVPSTSGPRNSN